MMINDEYMLNLSSLMKMFLMEQCFYLPFSRSSLGCNDRFVDKCEECFDKIITGEIEDGESAGALYECMMLIYDFCKSDIYDIVRGPLMHELSN